MDSPVGKLTLTEEGGEIIGLEWGGRWPAPEGGVLAEAAAQLAAYFEGTLEAFDLPLWPGESATQRAYSAAACAIPFGETRTYGEIAEDMGISAQAVGQCCGANPTAILIPCHRVLGANGLGGYSGAGGIETKVALLRHEGAAGLLI